jgi:hypothetical protein
LISDENKICDENAKEFESLRRVMTSIFENARVALNIQLAFEGDEFVGQGDLPDKVNPLLSRDRCELLEDEYSMLKTTKLPPSWKENQWGGDGRRLF